MVQGLTGLLGFRVYGSNRGLGFRVEMLRGFGVEEGSRGFGFSG